MASNRNHTLTPPDAFCHVSLAPPHRCLFNFRSRAELLTVTGISEADWPWVSRQLKEERKVAQEGVKRGARYRRAGVSRP